MFAGMGVGVASWTSFYALPHFVLLTGLPAWPTDQQEFDRLLAPPTRPRMMLAWWFKETI